MFEIVKMTHVCQYWRSTLISHPHLWSSIFVKNDHKDFVAACLERSGGVPLTVCLDLKHGDYEDYPDCTCIRNEWSSGMRINEANPCRYHTTIDPLLELDNIQRIRKLEVHLTMLDGYAEEGLDQDFKDALDDFDFFTSPLPALESLSFSVNLELDIDIDTHMHFPRDLFCWNFLPPTKLRHLTLHGCYGGPIQAVRNLTSFELAGVLDGFDPIELNQRTFLPFISGNPSLVSLRLSHCSFPDRAQPSRVIPAKLPELKSLQLIDIYGLPGLPGIIDVPAFRTLSSLRISARKQKSDHFSSYEPILFLIHAENDDGFKLSYDTTNDHEVASDWLGITHNADPTPAFVRFEGRELNPAEEIEMETSPLPLFVNAKVLEVGASFAGVWYRNFWKDLENVGPQLTTLRLEVIEGMDPGIGKSVKKFAEERLRKGVPLAKLERMTFEGMSAEDEEKAKKLWEEFRTGLDIDRFLVVS